MSTDELLRPRYKVIADYPFSVFPKDLVFELNILDARKHSAEQEYYMIYKENCYSESLINKYPAIFKKLEWYEDRKESDMPEYVSYKLLEGSTPKILKVEKHFYSSFGDYNSKGFMSDGYFYSYSKSLPITKEEYESQK